MSTPSPSTASPSMAQLLTAWLPHQRWFPGKGRDVEVTRSGGLRLLDSGGVVGVEVHLVTARYADGGSDTFQVPLTYRLDPAPELEHALVGVLEHPALGRVSVHDAPHDPVYCQALLRLISEQGWVTEADVTGEDPDGPSTGTARGVLQPGVPPPDPAMAAKVLTGEQSNTSIVYGAGSGSDAGTAVILKVFRTLHPGDNPDVAVQSALAVAGCLRVPQPIGWVEATWDDETADGTAPEGDRSRADSSGQAHGHLAFASEFIAGSQDAWRVACDAVERGQEWSEPAAELGRATAQVHATLAEVMPVAAADAGHLQRLAEDLLARLEWSVAAVPALRPHADAARTALEAVRDLTEPPTLQRIHGDYHLGQVLSHPERGWVLLDFEGEPLRPLSERVRPDLALRDVAGMLRSFDYAARHATVGVADDAQGRRQVAAAQVWSVACRDAFCAGYAHVTGTDPRDAVVLLRALELDKALYEVVYEARNRPAWLPIPMHAVQRLLAGADPNSGRNPVTKPRTTPSPVAGKRQPQPISAEDLDRIVSGRSHDPHSVLGPHPHDGAVTLRVLRPMASSVTALLPDGAQADLTHEHEGVWVGVLPVAQVPDYRLEVTYAGDDGPLTSTVDDPYRFLPTLGEVDQHLVREGRHENLWQVLGARVRRYDGPMGDVVGTSFAVWAPNARAVRVVADFNHWVGQQHAMRALGSSGVWELFVPGVGAGTRYKFEILGRDGHWRQKADPMAFGTEVPPSTASMVVESQYEWGDGDWMAARAAGDPHSGPVSVYEVHLGSWRQGLGYRELAGELVDYVQDMGFTHVELLPVAEHPFGGSWGYQVTSYYAPTSRFGHPDDLRYLIDRLHQAGIGVIVDWVPAHFPKDSWALASFDGEPLYEHGDPRRGEQQDWGTLVFDYGRSEVRNFLVANALYWLEEFHTDGLRVDAVASMLYLDYSREAGGWVPNKYGGREHLEAIDFLQETNATAYKRVPGIMMIAEESTAWPGVTRPTHLGGLGFGLKWNMGWMHDSLGYAAEDPVHRQYHHHRMTFSMMYAFSENFVLPISHDEVVHGKGSLLRKMPGDRWQQLANLRAFLAYMWAHPGKQLLFMGSEFGQESEWAESRSLDWWLLDQPVHRGVQSLVRDLNKVYGATPALWERDSDPSGFEWVDANDTVHNTFSFVRRDADGNPLVCVVNFAGAPHEGYRVGMPAGGTWREVLNTDAEVYGGSGVGNMGEVHAQEIPWHGMPASAVLRVPPLGALWLTPAGGS